MADIDNQQEIGRFITRLTVAIQNVGMYPDDHPQVLSKTQEAFDLLDLLLKDVREITILLICLLYTSPSPRDGLLSRMPSSA